MNTSMIESNHSMLAELEDCAVDSVQVGGNPVVAQSERQLREFRTTVRATVSQQFDRSRWCGMQVVLISVVIGFMLSACSQYSILPAPEPAHQLPEKFTGDGVAKSYDSLELSLIHI